MSLPSQYPSPAVSLSPDFYQHQLVLPALELHVSEITHYFLFVPHLLTQCSICKILAIQSCISYAFFFIAI